MLLSLPIIRYKEVIFYNRIKISYPLFSENNGNKTI